MPTSISAWFTSRGVSALPGYFISDTPWAGVKASSVGMTRTQGSALLGGGQAYPGGAINNERTTDHWLAAGTFKIAWIYQKGTAGGIATFQFDGVTQGTIDSYAAGVSENNYTEITGIAVTAGLKVVKVLGATKHASSTDYYLVTKTTAIVRTGA